MYLVERQIAIGKHSLKKRTKKIAERWIRNHTTRRKLGELDNNLLRDVGIDPLAAAQEASKPFWQN